MHWSREEVLGMNHLERLRWCREVSQINSRLNDDGDGGKQSNPFAL